MTEGDPSPESASRVAVELVARASYGRLLAWLAYQWRDLAAAEDALSTALAKALALWPQQGVPQLPDAWLLSVAKRELLQVARRERLHRSPEVQALLEDDAAWVEAPTIPDDRLKLLFVCAHPAIDAGIRPALMLQAVLGLDAQVVAQAMLTSPAAMAQRLVRAKQKIRIARLRFEEPGADELPGRLQAVLEAIYAAYGLGWDALDGGEAAIVGLRSEALFLGDLVCSLLPESAEALGLMAMMLFCEARTAARLDARGDFVPLPEQDTALWDRDMIARAERCLWRASGLESPGPFQLEAAIQSAHCQRLFGGDTPWGAVADLYRQLLALAPTLGAEVAHALAWARAGESERASELLLSVDPARRANYQPYWVAKAYVERLSGEQEMAVHSLTQAVGLTSSPAARRYLLGQLAALTKA
ncbi:RNA polymerase sigma factor [Hydrogenophaga sp. RWCD_12]|uniref:RNA polymerase sigma factor n=1 Tax=Hydrogenophaga sp. RWCD_12 TaxID=3391190 RepID=UPI0039852ED8